MLHQLIKPVLQQPIKPMLNVLISYAYMRNVNDKDTTWIYNVPGVRFLLDCGAFTALNAGKEINLDTYMHYLSKWKHKFFGYIALDKLGDPKQTDINLNKMLKNGFKPIPVHVRGDKKDRMDELFKYNDLVALGGFRRPHKAEGSPMYVKQKMEWAAGRNVHWLGYTRQIMLNTFQPFSCDSSSASSSRRWGRTWLYKDQFTPPMDFSYKEFLQTKIPLWVHEIIEQLGYSYTDMLDEGRWRCCRSTNIASIISHSSYVRYCFDMERNIGTKYFIATTTACMYELFYAYGKINNISYCASERMPTCLM